MIELLECVGVFFLVFFVGVGLVCGIDSAETHYRQHEYEKKRGKNRYK